MDKKRASPKASPSNTQVHYTNGHIQRLGLLEAMRLGPIDTFTAIRELNIVRPAARVSELRAMGYVIRTIRTRLPDDQGRMHAGIARYVLLREPSR